MVSHGKHYKYLPGDIDDYIPKKTIGQQVKRKMSKLLEITLQKLQQSTVDAFPDTKKRQHKSNTVNISQVKFLPYQKSNVLKVEGVATSGPNRYNCTMTFEDVYYEESDSNQVVSFKGVDDQSYHIHPLKNDVNDVKVKCTCMDFHYRFAQANYQADGLEGNPPPPYVKKTDRPDVNPETEPGMCKHLVKLKEHLTTINLLG